MSDDYQILRELFVAACDLSHERQLEFLEQHCGDDAAICSRLEQLLAEDRCTNKIFADDPAGTTGKFEIDTVAALDTPARIGQYRIKNILGEGGMGTVYLARQEQPARDVAVKVLQNGLMNRSMLKRFELEANVLGRLQHPGIARIFEAGTFHDGRCQRPFFAMEFVDGVPLHEYLKTMGPAIPEKLRLFAKICDAVHHAHQNSVIHRDLKPANILVTADGQAKILDFGVARATDADVLASNIQTRTGQLIGTLPYMSPEQLSGGTENIDTRSDVYALGVLLYEMLTGRLPRESGSELIPDAILSLHQSAPVKISQRDRSLRGDIETIVHKALESNRELRYQSASEFAADVNRFLSDEPIQARPHSTIYQLKKLIRRNRTAVIATVFVLLALAVGTIFSTVSMVRAQQQAAKADSINAYLESVLIAADTLRSGDTRLIDLLQAASDRVDQDFAGHPDLALRVHRMLTQAFHNISLYDEAEFHANAWLQQIQRQHGRSHRLSREPKIWMARALREQAKFRHAENIIREVIDDSRGRVDREFLVARGIYGNLAGLLGRYDEAEEIIRDSLATAEEMYGPLDHLTITQTWYLAQMLDNRARYADDDPQEKQGMTEEAVELMQRVIRDEPLASPNRACSLQARMRLAEHYRRGEDFERAAHFARAALDDAIEHLGEHHPAVQVAENRLIKALHGAGNSNEAALLLIQSIQRHRSLVGDSLDIIIRMAEGLPILDAGCQWDTALQYATLLTKRFGPESGHGDFGLVCRIWTAYLHSRLQQPDEAEQVFDELLPARESLSPGHLASLDYALGIWHASKKEDERAINSLAQALELRKTEAGKWPTQEQIERDLQRLENHFDTSRPDSN